MLDGRSGPPVGCARPGGRPAPAGGDERDADPGGRGRDRGSSEERSSRQQLVGHGPWIRTCWQRGGRDHRFGEPHRSGPPAEAGERMERCGVPNRRSSASSTGGGSFLTAFARDRRDAGRPERRPDRVRGHGGRAPRPAGADGASGRRCCGPATRSASRSGRASRPGSCTRSAPATTGRSSRSSARCSATSTRCSPDPGVRYLSGFFGPAERFLVDSGADVEFVPADFRRFIPVAERLAPPGRRDRRRAARRRRLHEPLAARGRDDRRDAPGRGRSRSRPDRRDQRRTARARSGCRRSIPTRCTSTRSTCSSRATGPSSCSTTPNPPTSTARSPATRGPSSPTARRCRPASAGSRRRSSACSPRKTAATTASTRRCSRPA